MNFADYLKDTNVQEIKFNKLAAFFLKHFTEIKDIEDFTSEYKSYIIDITDTPERKAVQALSGLPIGALEYISHSFLFNETKGITYGIIYLDFINTQLVNVSMQLFVDGFSSPLIITKEFNELQEFLTNLYGAPKEDSLFMNLVWNDISRNCVMAVGREKNPKDNLTFTITNNKLE